MSNWQEYLDHGWKLVELRPGTKKPRVDGWQKAGAPFSATTISAGLVHEHSGTCALDIDDMAGGELWLAEHSIDLVGLLNAEDRVEIIGNPKNHGKLLYRLPEPLRSKKVIEGKKNILDFRCIGNQDVLPPSMHPDTGVPYAWAYGDSALGHWSQLPALPAALEALWRSMLTPATATQPDPDVGAQVIPVADLEAWLTSKDPDMDREGWIAVGMRIHQATNGQGFYIWDNWSRKGEKYKGGLDLQAPWRSFHVGGGLGIGQILADKVADKTEFPIEEPSEFTPGADLSDDTVFSRAYRLLRPRLVYLTAQSRFWGQPAEPRIEKLDRHLGGPLKREDLASMFERWMPSTRSSNGKEFRQKPLEFWNRHVVDPLMARAPNFNPGGGAIFTDRDGYDYVNTYKPYVVQPLAPRPNEIEAWDWLWSRVESESYRRWLKQFFAFIMLNPGEKVTAAPLLYGDPGTGKSTIMKRIPELLYGSRNVHLMSNKVLRSQFSDALTGTWFLVLDELKTDGGKQDRVELANEMKPWITEPELQIHPKGLPPYYVTNRLQLTATSNNDDAVHITRNDRRWAICEMGGGPMTTQQKLDLYDEFLETDRAPGVLRWLMERVDLVGFTRTTQAPDTAGRQEMIRAGLGEWESKLAEAAYSGAPPFDRDAFKATDIRENLMGMKAPNVYRINSVLRKAGIPTKSMHTALGNLIVWQNADLWRQAGGTALLRHVETGERPSGFKWTREIPIAIRRLAGDDDSTDPNADLLGEINGYS